MFDFEKNKRLEEERAKLQRENIKLRAENKDLKEIAQTQEMLISSYQKRKARYEKLLIRRAITMEKLANKYNIKIDHSNDYKELDNEEEF